MTWTPRPRGALPKPRPERPGWRQFRSAVREIADSARVRETPVLFVLFPEFEPGIWTTETHPNAEVYRKVRATVTEERLEVLDLTPVFAAEARDGRSWWATFYDHHPSAEAHDLAARTIAELIERSSWLGRRVVEVESDGVTRPGSRIPTEACR